MRYRDDASLKGIAVVSLAACLALGALACQGPSQETAEAERTARAGPEAEDEVIAAHQALVNAYETGDVEAYLNLLVPGPELLIFHPAMEDRFDGRAAARESLREMFSRMGDSEWTDVHPAVTVHGDVAWLTEHLLIKSPEMEREFIGRGTEIWVRSDTGDWRLVHGHWSPHP